MSVTASVQIGKYGGRGRVTDPATDGRILKRRPVARRFLRRCVPHPTEMFNGHPCWEWKGGRIPAGYGTFTTDHRTKPAHRVSHEQFKGPIPVGLEIDHLCRNRWCVNPTHLEAVTKATNVRRSDSLAGRRSRQTHCMWGHEFDEANTYISKRGWRECRKCRVRKEALMAAKGTRGKCRRQWIS